LKLFYCITELYTNTRFLSLKDKPQVPVGVYTYEEVKEAIVAHWHWVEDTFTV
jgi:hypothetical protein